MKYWRTDPEVLSKEWRSLPSRKDTRASTETVTNLFVTFSYVVAMWSNLVVPCITNPDNWKYCLNDWDVWLYPEIHRAWELMSGEETPYQEEKDMLQSGNKE